MGNKEQEFLAHVKEMTLMNQSLELLNWDAETGMPEGAAEFRGEATSLLSSLAFEMETGEKMKGYIRYFAEQPEELSDLGKLVYQNVCEQYDLNRKLPGDKYREYVKLQSISHSKWLKAREAKDFQSFQPYLERIIGYLKEFIPLWQKDEKTPYDVLLNQYEPDMTVEILDEVFSEMRKGIMDIRETLDKRGTAPTTSFIHRRVTVPQQKKFVTKIITDLGYDFKSGRLDDTVHPFMLGINRKDVRITTRWSEDDFTMATFGVIHEAGHGMYEQNIDGKFDYTPLATGTSMGIHESQSLFNQIMIGSSKAFWKKQYPFFQEVTEGTFDDVDFETFYKGLKETKASFVRIESDDLTYPLHIIIRYEIEKMIFNEEVEVADLPQIWNDKYEEYLGIRPKNDLEGILQDVHWAHGLFGYFPSYALGYMYAAQLYHSLKKEVPVEEVLGSDDYTPIQKWLRTNIHQYGASRKPNQLIKDATGEELNPSYLIEYMKNIYFDVYGIKE